MITIDKVIDEINSIGNINSITLDELEAAAQALSKATTISTEQAGAALKAVIDRINEEKEE